MMSCTPRACGHIFHGPTEEFLVGFGESSGNGLLRRLCAFSALCLRFEPEARFGYKLFKIAERSFLRHHLFLGHRISRYFKWVAAAGRDPAVSLGCIPPSMEKHSCV
jgi:hypothetical protein